MEDRKNVFVGAGKADILESLTEEQLTELKANIDKENPANGGCVFTTPCILVECFHSSQA